MSVPDHVQKVDDNIAMVQRRLDFMDLDSDTRNAIKSLKPFIERELPKGLDLFYAKVRQVPQVSRFFSSDQQMTHAKSAQLGHWANISNGDFGAEYARKIQTIGSVHARIGLEPTWYIGGYALITEHLVKTLIKEMFPKGGFMSRKTISADALGDALGGLLKAVFLDMDLAISVYLDEAEVAKKKAQEEAIANEQRTVGAVFGRALEAIADKDMSYRVTEDLPEAYDGLKRNFNSALEELSSIMTEIKASSAEIQAGSGEIKAATDDLAKRTEQQAASVEETAAALSEITTTVAGSTRRAEEAGSLVAKTRQNAERSGDIVKEAIAAMSAIESSSSQIANIIGVIDEIAFQTNLLALNAGVEAARAGEAGKGFAVVAQEVRELAQRSAQAAKEIKSLISSSGEQVKQGVALVGRTGDSLAEIVVQVKEINNNVAAIVEAAREQAIGLKEINTAVNAMDQGTQHNAAMVEETTAATHQLSTEVENIVDKLDAFRLAGPSPATGKARPKPADASPARQMLRQVATAFGRAS